MTRKERWRDKFPAGGNEMEELQGEKRAELHETSRNLATLDVSTPREFLRTEETSAASTGRKISQFGSPVQPTLPQT